MHQNSGFLLVLEEEIKTENHSLNNLFIICSDLNLEYKSQYSLNKESSTGKKKNRNVHIAQDKEYSINYFSYSA